jgi:hypothetical protein
MQCIRMQGLAFRGIGIWICIYYSSSLKDQWAQSLQIDQWDLIFTSLIHLLSYKFMINKIIVYMQVSQNVVIDQ